MNQKCNNYKYEILQYILYSGATIMAPEFLYKAAGLVDYNIPQPAPKLSYVRNHASYKLSHIFWRFASILCNYFHNGTSNNYTICML